MSSIPYYKCHRTNISRALTNLLKAETSIKIPGYYFKKDDYDKLQESLGNHLIDRQHPLNLDGPSVFHNQMSDASSALKSTIELFEGVLVVDIFDETKWLYIFYDESFFLYCNKIKSGTFVFDDKPSLKLQHLDPRVFSNRGFTNIACTPSSIRIIISNTAEPFLRSQGFKVNTHFSNGVCMDFTSPSETEIFDMIKKLCFYSFTK